jgi:hypothetical protein
MRLSVLLASRWLHSTRCVRSWQARASPIGFHAIVSLIPCLYLLQQTIRT